MGYRSAVTSCIYGEAEAVTSFLTKQKLVGNPVFSFFEDDLKVDTFKSYDGGKEYKILVLELSDSKWYPTFEDVKAWENLLDEADEVEDLEWEFVIVGEDGQTEERYSENPEYLISVNRSIEINYGGV